MRCRSTIIQSFVAGLVAIFGWLDHVHAQTEVPLPGSDIPLPGEQNKSQESSLRLSNSLPASWSIRGYIENTLNLEYLHEKDQVYGINATRMRTNLEGRPNKHFDFSIGLVGLLFTGKTQMGLAQYLPDAIQASLYPGDPDAGLPNSESFLTYQLNNRLYLQEAFGTLYTPYLKIRAGRQKFYTGNGYAYDPIDLFNHKDPLDPTYEIDGIDAILAVLELPMQFEIESLVRLSDRFNRSDYLGRVKTSLGGWDLAVQYTSHIRSRIDWKKMTSSAGVTALTAGVPISDFERQFRWQLVAAELTGEIAGIGVHAQGGYVFIEAIDDPGTLTQASKDHERLLVGFDYTFDCQLFVLAEYMRIGQARTKAQEIDLNDRMAYYSGAVLSNNRDTLFIGASYPMSELSEIAIYAVIGLNDPSALVNPWLSFDLYPGLKLSVTGIVPVGTQTGQNGKASPGGFARMRFSF